MNIESILETINITHNEMLHFKELLGVSTLQDKGDYIIKNRTIFKESFLNRRRELLKITTFTQENVTQKLMTLLNDEQVLKTYYENKINQQTITYYDNNATTYFDNTKSLEMKAIYETFLKTIPQGGSILDCGCGSGRDSHYFKQQGYNVVSFDASQELVKLANENFNLNASCNTFETFENDTSMKYDGIFFMASLLHLNKEELIKVLKKFKEFLKPNGTIYMSLKEGEVDKEQIIGNRYFHYWTQKTMNNIIKKVGLKGECFITGDKKTHEKQAEPWLNFTIQPTTLKQTKILKPKNI